MARFAVVYQSTVPCNGYGRAQVKGACSLLFVLSHENCCLPALHCILVASHRLEALALWWQCYLQGHVPTRHAACGGHGVQLLLAHVAQAVGHLPHHVGVAAHGLSHLGHVRQAPAPWHPRESARHPRETTGHPRETTRHPRRPLLVAASCRDGRQVGGSSQMHACRVGVKGWLCCFPMCFPLSRCWPADHRALYYHILIYSNIHFARGMLGGAPERMLAGSASKAGSVAYPHASRSAGAGLQTTRHCTIRFWSTSTCTVPVVYKSGSRTTPQSAWAQWHGLETDEGLTELISIHNTTCVMLEVATFL